MHTHTSVHTHSHGFPGLEIGSFGIWAIQAFWILLIWKAHHRLSTRHREHISRATLASLGYRTQHTVVYYSSVSIRLTKTVIQTLFSTSSTLVAFEALLCISFFQKIRVAHYGSWVFSDNPKGFSLFSLFPSTLPTCCLCWPMFKSLPGCARETTNYHTINPLTRNQPFSNDPQPAFWHKCCFCSVNKWNSFSLPVFNVLPPENHGDSQETDNLRKTVEVFGKKE